MTSWAADTEDKAPNSEDFIRSWLSGGEEGYRFRRYVGQRYGIMYRQVLLRFLSKG